LRVLEIDRKVPLYGGLIYELPTPPPANQIMNHDLAPSKQKWVRPDILQEWFDTEDKIGLETREIARRINGFWFYNNGIPTYITGHHYYQLTYCRYGFGFADFRDTTKRWWYFWDMAEKNPFCFGVIRAKGRRMGATSDGQALCLNTLTMTENAHIGLNSTTEGAAYDNFEEIVDILLELPDFSVPPREGKDRPKKAISLREPSKVLTRAHNKATRGNSLNSKLDYAETTIKAYDRRALKLHFPDEGGKWTNCNFSKFCEIHKKCLEKGGLAYGKAYMPSTTNEMEHGGGKFFKEIWDMSDMEKKNENGATLSGYWRHFTPAYDGFENFIDEYGMSIIDEPTPSQLKFLKSKWVERGLDLKDFKPIGAKQYLENERKAISNRPDKYHELIRMMPFTEKEAFLSSNKASQFNLIKINEQYEWNETSLLTGKLILQRGNFEWKNNEQDTEVIWMPNDNGRWLISWFPKSECQNKSFIKNGKKAPSFDKEGCFGADPVDRANTNFKRQSDYASYGFKYETLFDNTFSNIFFAQYVNRLPIPEKRYEDMIKQCVFYGYPIFGEINNPGTVNYFYQRGYEHYLLDRPETLYAKGADKNRKKEKWMPSRDLRVRQMMLDNLESFIEQNVGYIESNGGFHELPKIPFNALLDELMKYNLGDDLTDYDSIVAAIYALSTQERRLKPKVERPKYVPVIKKFVQPKRNLNGRL